MGGDLPSMPYFKDTKGNTFSGSINILKAVASEYCQGALGESEEENQKLEQARVLLEDLNVFLTGYCYGQE